MERRIPREQLDGNAADLFAVDPLAIPVRRSVRVLSVASPALALGSTQRDDVVDLDRARTRGVSVVRRRSGGGAVWLDGGSIVWVDVVIASTDALWVDDVSLAFDWIGVAWAAAIAVVHPHLDVDVHHGPLITTRWSTLLCFAGLGPGEVRADGRKVVGISQRRTRAGALFQCGVLRSWSPDALVDVLDLTEAERAQAIAATRDSCAGVDADAVVGRFVEDLTPLA